MFIATWSRFSRCASRASTRRFFKRVDSPVETRGPLLGQAFNQQGPVILVWDTVLHDARHPEQGHNVVYHEFAHKLDMLSGSANGTLPLVDCDQLAEWVAVCSREFLRLRHLAEKGHKTFLGAYYRQDPASRINRTCPVQTG